MVVHCNSLGLFGLDAFLVEVEADVSNGMAAFDIVGLPDAAVKESRDRVRAALKNCGFTFPLGRITINLAPADIRKEGPLYDLPILAALLQATGQIAPLPDDVALIGELSLSGEIRRINGILPMAIHAKQSGIKKLFVPYANAQEGAVVQGLCIYPVQNLKQLLLHLNGRQEITPARLAAEPALQPPNPAGFFPGQRSVRSKARYGGRRRRRPQYPTGRPARLRQKYACQAPAFHFAGHAF